MKLILAIAILLPVIAWSQTSYVPATRLLRKKGYQIGIEGDVFRTSQVVDSDGKKQDLPEGESFSRFQSEIFGQYGATSDLQFGVGARFRQNEAVRRINGEDVNASSSGIQSTFFSIMYGFKPVGKLQYTLEGLFRFTPYSNDDYDANDNEKMILGDDGNEISGGLGLTYSSETNNFLTARAGYRKPGTGLSGEIYWQAEGALAWRYIALVAGVDGVTSLKGDEYSDAPTQKPPLNTANTYLYNSIDREWIAPYAGINIALGKTWRVELRGSQTVSGNSTDLGTTFGVSLIRRVEETANQYAEKTFKTYDLEASVSKVSPKKEYVVIDKGIDSDVEKGMSFDFYEFDYVGGNVLIARGVVIQLKSSTAIVKITQRYNTKKEIKEGLTARAKVN